MDGYTFGLPRMLHFLLPETGNAVAPWRKRREA